MKRKENAGQHTGYLAVKVTTGMRHVILSNWKQSSFVKNACRKKEKPDFTQFVICLHT
jgi:hypothetical protein